MHVDYAQGVYDTLCGQAEQDACIPGVENAFARGCVCDRSYEAAVEAKNRILMRLGVDEDPDVDRIFGELMYIARQLSLKMFAYGNALVSGMGLDENTD